MKNRKIIILLLIILILIAITYMLFFITKNKTKYVRNESENLIKAKQEAGEKMKVDVSEYNRKMQVSNSFKSLVKIIDQNSDTYEFTSEQMMAFVIGYANSEEQDILKENMKVIEEEQPVYIKYEYLNGLCKKYFDKELEKEELQDYLKDDYLYVSLPTRYPSTLYKFNELRYDSNNDIYSLFFDKINLDASDYDNIKKYDTVDFDYNAVEKNYRILYKIKGNDKIIVGIEEIK